MTQTICYPQTVKGFYDSVDYLLANDTSPMAREELLAAVLSFPHGRRENFVSIIQRANSLRIQAVNKAIGFNNLKYVLI